MSDQSDELRRQLGTLWRMAQDGLGTVRDLAVWSSQTGRLRVDLALLQRERDGLYQQLGQQAAVLIGDGRLAVPRPVRETYDRIREIDARIRAGTVRLHDNAFGAPRGFEPEAAEDYNYNMTEEVDAGEPEVVKDHSQSRTNEEPAKKPPAGRTKTVGRTGQAKRKKR